MDDFFSFIGDDIDGQYIDENDVCTSSSDYDDLDNFIEENSETLLPNTDWDSIIDNYVYFGGNSHLPEDTDLETGPNHENHNHQTYRSKHISFTGSGKCKCGCGSYVGSLGNCDVCDHPWEAHAR